MGLNLFLQWFVLDLFIFGVLVFYFSFFIENQNNVYCSYEVIGNSLFVYFYSLSFYFVSYLVIYFDSCYC